jgi:outer membrane protein OmpA-like peptidoglycan-associated protein
MKAKLAFLTLIFALAASSMHAQQSAASMQRSGPTYRITMVPGTITAVNYQNRESTEIGFRGSPVLPLATGHAKITSRPGRISIEADFSKLQPAQTFGQEFLTYVFWAITPEGKASNLGEVLLDGDKSKISVTTSLQTFGLIVTAEPYYAVASPSDALALVNVVLPETAGTIEQINASYQMLGRGAYTYDVATVMARYPKSKTPLELDEARNAVEIARHAGADQYAPDAFAKAQASLRDAEERMAARGDRKVIVQDSRDAVQNAAEAEQITVRRIQEIQAEQEKEAAARQAADAQAAAAAAAASQQQEQIARERAELQKQEAEAKAAQEAAARAEADAARAKAQAEAQEQQQAAAAAQREATAAQQQAAAAQAAAEEAERQREQLRATLLEQFNRILPTTDTPRGLKANLADVLFATAKYDLQPPAREALAKFSGIVIAHPGLKLAIEGYTDSTGSDEFNQTLSENRANSVRAYLIGQGIDPNAITATGYGKSNPVASNDTAAGRRLNRRVEIIISGEIIGTQIGATQQNPSNPSMQPGQAPPPNQPPQ